MDFLSGLGVQTGLVPASYADGAKTTASNAILAAVRAAGYTWTRVAVHVADHWYLNGATPSAAWTFDGAARLDALFAGIAGANLKAIVLIDAPPVFLDAAYASYGGYDAQPAADSPANGAYATFAALLAARYEALYPGRFVWEVGNEPNLLQFAKPAPNAANYLAALYKVGSAIKNATRSIANPEGAYVLGMTTSRVPLDWFRALAAHPAADVVDAVGPHPYTDNDNGFDYANGFGPANSNPDPMNGDPASAVASFLQVANILKRPRYRRSRTPIAVVSPEWGQSEAYTSALPTDAMTPAYSATYTADGSSQLLQNTANFSGWNIGPESSLIAGYNGYSGFRITRRRFCGDPALGFWAAAIHELPNGAGAYPDNYPAQWPTKTPYFYRFWARLAPGETSPADVFAGVFQDHRSIRLESGTWTEFRGSYNPGTAWWYQDGGSSRVFVLGAKRSGGAFEVSGLQVWKPSPAQYQTARENRHATRCGQIVAAARKAGCPLHIHYRWNDLLRPGDAGYVGPDPGPIEGRYGVVRVDGSLKPAVAAMMAALTANPLLPQASQAALQARGAIL